MAGRRCGLNACIRSWQTAVDSFIRAARRRGRNLQASLPFPDKFRQLNSLFSLVSRLRLRTRGPGGPGFLKATPNAPTRSCQERVDSAPRPDGPCRCIVSRRPRAFPNRAQYSITTAALRRGPSAQEAHQSARRLARLVPARTRPAWAPPKHQGLTPRVWKPGFR